MIKQIAMILGGVLGSALGIALGVAIAYALLCLAAGTQDVYTNDSAYMMDVGVE